ncbi:hypothetical protein [Deinococcus misasensis]|uniref:hypothetical protein n=1 Tax=Deinococcus misasensis TaxID=392413 RepID=UPI00054FAFF6|nr:hypothetical protein [Deinococcus misasensis]
MTHNGHLHGFIRQHARNESMIRSLEHAGYPRHRIQQELACRGISLKEFFLSVQMGLIRHAPAPFKIHAQPAPHRKPERLRKRHPNASKRRKGRL